LAQTKTGTTIGTFLLIEPSARAAGMGNAGVTTFQEAVAAFYNPGAVGLMAQSDVQFTYSRWLADITYNYTAAAICFGTANTLLLTITALNSGEIDVRTVDQPLGTGERYSVNDLAFGLGYARRVTDRFSAGVQVQYVRETVWHSALTALALDFGVLYELPFGALLGASISNFGSRGQYDGRDLRIRYDRTRDQFGDNSNLPAALETEGYPLPILFRVGLGLPVSFNESNTFTLAVDAFQPSDNTNSISVGGEWTFLKVLSVRAGYQNLFQEDSETGLSLGTGLQYQFGAYRGHADFSWNEYGRIGNVQRFTAGFSF
jgi:hypothetical protein